MRQEEDEDEPGFTVGTNDPEAQIFIRLWEHTATGNALCRSLSARRSSELSGSPSVGVPLRAKIARSVEVRTIDPLRAK